MKRSVMLKRIMVALCLGAFLTLPTFSGVQQAQAAQTKFVTVGTGGMTGVYYPVGGAICRLVNKGNEEHGVRCNTQATGASVFNVNAIRTGDLAMGIVQSDVQYYAYNGVEQEQFIKAGPDKDLRALFSLQSESFTLVARDDAAIQKFSDLAGKRMNIGDPGSGNRSTTELLMKEYGWDESIFKLATDLKPAEMAAALCDNKIDAYVYVVAHPNGSTKEAATTCDSHIVPVAGPEVDKFVEKYPFYPKSLIPGGMYRGTNDDVATFGPRATLMTNASLSDEVAYAVTKAVFTNLEEFKRLHPALGGLTAQNMLEGNSVPYHPGAIKYFKEAGLMK